MKTSTKVAIALSVISMMILVITVGYLGFVRDITLYSWTSEYSIEINTNSTERYVAIVPIAMRSGDEVCPTMDKIELKDGDAVFSIIDTQFGKGLRINGTGDVEIGVELAERKTLEPSPKADVYKITNISLISEFNEYGFNYEGVCQIQADYSDWENKLSVKMNTHWWDFRHTSSMGMSGGGISITFSIDSVLHQNGWNNSTFEGDYFPMC